MVLTFFTLRVLSCLTLFLSSKVQVQSSSSNITLSRGTRRISIGVITRVASKIRDDTRVHGFIDKVISTFERQSVIERAR